MGYKGGKMTKIYPMNGEFAVDENYAKHLGISISFC